MGAGNSKQNAQRTNATPLQPVQTFGGEGDDNLEYESNNNSNSQMGGRRRRGKKTRRGSKKRSKKSRRSRK